MSNIVTRLVASAAWHGGAARSIRAAEERENRASAAARRAWQLFLSIFIGVMAIFKEKVAAVSWPCAVWLCWRREERVKSMEIKR